MPPLLLVPVKLNEIKSSSNPLLKTIRALHQRNGRKKSGLFLIEGRKAVAEAFAKRLPIENVVVSQTYLQSEPEVLSGCDVRDAHVVEDKLFLDLVTQVTPEGILAVSGMPIYETEDLLKTKTPALIVVAHSIQDPGNLGTMIRTALAASASGMVLCRGTVDPFNPKVVRAAMGALFALPIVWDVDYAAVVAQLKSHGIKVIACQQDAKLCCFDADLKSPLALVLGNEGQGLSHADLQLADEFVSIPMNPQSESLNVAVAASIVLFSAVQQRLSARS